MKDHIKENNIGIIILQQQNLGFPNWDCHHPIICNPPPLQRVPKIPLWKEIGPSQAPTTADVLTTLKGTKVLH